MKKLMFAVVAAATLVSNGAFAQNAVKPKVAAQTGSGAQSGMYASSDTFAWGIGLGVLVVVGVIVGVTVAAATSSVNSH